MTDLSSFTFLPLGGIIQEFRVADHNIVLGFPHQSQYAEYNIPHFGETIGRVANRVKDAVLRDLNGGRDYQLARNNGPNSIHGGEKGWGKRVFEGPFAVVKEEDNGSNKKSMMFKYLSEDGEEGYPGSVELRIWYTASREDEKTVLTVEYEVEFVGDECEETVVNITNHSYFNLGNTPTIEGTKAQLFTDSYLPVDTNGIPLGKIDKFPGNVTAPFILHTTEPQLDDCFVVESDPSRIPLDTRTQPLKLLGRFENPTSRLHLEVHSTEPAFQFYTGEYIDVPQVEGAPPRGQCAGFCVEPGRYINAANEPAWRSMCLLKRGEVYGCKNVYKAWQE